MRPEPKLAPEPTEAYGSLFVLALLAPIVGAASGLLGGSFRIALAAADRFRHTWIASAHNWGFTGFLCVAAGCAAAVALAAWLVRRFSLYAAGSCIPQVEAVLSDELPPPPPRLLFVKFFGGLFAIGSGLALGREGPSVQMGAVVAHTFQENHVLVRVRSFGSAKRTLEVWVLVAMRADHWTAARAPAHHPRTCKSQTATASGTTLTPITTSWPSRMS